MSQNYTYPPGFATSNNTSVGTNGNLAPPDSTQVAGQDPSGDLAPLQLDVSGNLLVSIASGIANPLPVTDAAAEASLASIDSHTPTLGQKTMAGSSPVVIASDQSAVPISAASLPLPAGASTSAKQPALGVAGTASTDVITVQGIAAMTPLAVSAGSLPLPTGAATEATLLAFSGKSAGALVPEAFDYIDIAYVGATTDIDTVTYKLGGSGGSTVATLTLAYDGSDRLTSVTKT